MDSSGLVVLNKKKCKKIYSTPMEWKLEFFFYKNLAEFNISSGIPFFKRSKCSFN
jgi:hypothetical protein